MLDEIERKRVQYPFFKKKVLFSWVSFGKYKGKRKKVCSQPAWFYYKRFDEFFRFYIKNMFPFLLDRRLQLVSIGGQLAKNKDMFFEYKYFLTPKDYADFLAFKRAFHHPDHPHRIITYVFNLIIMIFGKLMNEITKDLTQITMLCADIKKVRENEFCVHFIITTRPEEINFLQQYLRAELFHLSERLPNIPKSMIQRLRNHQLILAKTAMKEYPEARATLSSVLLTIYLKCLTLEECTPILDILNYICSRVEDSIFNTRKLVREILDEKFRYPKKTDAQIEGLFEFFNQNATLFSTFQSNNRATKDRQYQLFRIYLQYYLKAGFELNENSISYYFPEKFLKSIQDMRIIEDYPAVAIETCVNFIASGSIDNPAIDLIFKRLFNQTVFEMNEAFFESFLYSLNRRFILYLQELQTKNPDFDFSFKNIMLIMCNLMYNLVLRVFIAETPEIAKENFRDKLGRYTANQVALRVMELRVFKDIPLSDSNWQDYYLSRNKAYVKKFFQHIVDIPDSYFFSPERLLKINIIYDRGLLDTTMFLEEWVVTKILKEFCVFYKGIHEKMPKNYTDEILRTTLVSHFSQGIVDEIQRDHIEDFVNDFIDVWER